MLLKSAPQIGSTALFNNTQNQRKIYNVLRNYFYHGAGKHIWLVLKSRVEDNQDETIN